MQNEKRVYGHIDCPLCGHAQGMRITADKNGAPFGFCEASCDGQLRVGGKPRREAAFFAKYPHIAAAFKPEQQPEPVQEKEPVTVTEKPAAKRAAFALDDLV